MVKSANLGRISAKLQGFLSKKRLTDKEYAQALKAVYNHKPKLSSAVQIELRDKIAALHLAKKETKKRVDLTLKDFAKLKARDFILDSIGGPDALFVLVTKIYNQAKRGSFKHQELLMNYLLGKPVDRIKLENAPSGSVVSRPVLQILADNIRLDRLDKDVKAASVMSDDRIKEMEDILNNKVNGNT